MAATGDDIPGKKYKCLVSINVNHKRTVSLVDTGATSSAISLSFFHSLPENERTIGRESQRLCVSVNGQIVKSLFTVVLMIIFDSMVIHHEFEVIDNLINHVLLGTDFLKSHKAKLDFSSDELLIGMERIKFEVPGWQSDGLPRLNSLELLSRAPWRACAFVEAFKEAGKTIIGQ